jgi:hypothetical protein
MHPPPSSEAINDILRWPIVRGGVDFGVDGTAPIIAHAIEIELDGPADKPWRETLESRLMDPEAIQRVQSMPAFVEESKMECICPNCHVSM